MKEDGLRRVEAELGLTLPGNYRRLLVALPFTPVGGDRVYRLYDDPGEVIRATRSPLNKFYERMSWRPAYIVLGETAMGDQYLLDLSRTPPPVLCLSHETHEAGDEFPDLPAFVAAWTEDVAEAGGRHERGRAVAEVLEAIVDPRRGQGLCNAACPHDPSSCLTGGEG